ncbi:MULTISPECIES: tRNA (adenosine(37)-N6)-threonylcarbamoyltransferase complex transferase subunit TsaD [Croceibacter]|jgi:N6-L-threonylcarbamoyladenine synthase|uniref:tRNA (adenosine(37)-N6)-threonylcarbamoyltransferase complex transferase subunit TsaD n=1 Tax=Croceibacter TaxID=216431 RepID=UPI000C687BE4|nr:MULTISPECIES: tRNA (adenosine(37)-N6)-threonylcarbamoyltransferase complex transferase subunit TsaD [Croceibacter]MBG24860.1 tRNA (adenosine(37)-N6)-threonylcarbamoyltransferase complex transferase subunit TsaD [Croceibacter sp.]WSP34542.1 tRNA (adenosine(37)-N6)-threonylcarbamoyltransferase complex transferase subunit TsaD [Croceibacter atlanticus]|tara:strand:+ start:2188 stop:3210 length:1023 start_codon:yes stop_codon:yes gene_type:complete
MSSQKIYILGIESSCDDTAAAVICNGEILSNVVATQQIHIKYGGVVPELASRAHQQHIVPVVHQALEQAGITKEDLHGIAFTKGPGLMGSLLVGVSFAKSLAMGLNIPLLDVNHMQGHILAHFIEEDGYTLPTFPFLAMTISGGHTQIVKVNDYFDMDVIGQTLDDAVGEAFDKSGKLLGLKYPAGPEIDKLAKQGNPKAFPFSKPKVGGLDFSFSGLKTAILYFIQKKVKENPNFIEENLADICASIQFTIISILMAKLKKAVKDTGITQVAIGGGVSANSGIRDALKQAEHTLGWTTYVPKFEYTTDNAGMIAITGYHKYLKQDFADITVVAKARLAI